MPKITLTDEQTSRLRAILNGDEDQLDRNILRDELFPELALPIPLRIDRTWWISHEGKVYIWHAVTDALGGKWQVQGCRRDKEIPVSCPHPPAPSSFPAALPRTGGDSGEPLDDDIVF